MRKTFKILNIVFILLLCTWTTKTYAISTVCATSQTYSALEAIKEHAPVEMQNHYAVAQDLDTILSEDSYSCDLLISSDEKLPVLLVRAGKASSTAITTLVRTPLLLWSADPLLLDNKATAVAQKRLKSLAIPNAKLTPVGYAASQIVSRKNFPTEYLKGRIYRAEHEYQILSMVESGNVQAGFLTKPLIMDKNGQLKGSYWQPPRNLYPELDYYLVILKSGEKKQEVKELANYLKNDAQALDDFINAGFDRPSN